MAGDWIKLEHATLDKPEIARLAELLDISSDAAVGLMVRFWVWFDRNSRDGRVTHAFPKGVESVMHCAGFVAAMTDVGWLHIDQEKGILTIPNPHRHNSSTAKSRALHKDRQQKYRDASVTLGASPEKRREEVKPIPIGTVELKSFVGEESPSPLNGGKHGKAKPASRATRLPADWSLPDDWRDWAVAAYRMDPQQAVRISLGFRDWFLQKPGVDGTSLDWRRRWQVWVRREMEGKRA